MNVKLNAAQLPEDRINLAIRSSLDHMLKLADDSITAIPIIHKVNDTTWRTEELTYLDYNSYPALLHKALHKAGIDLEYQVAFKSCLSLEILLGYGQHDFIEDSIVPCQGRNRTDDCVKLEIQFSPNFILAAKPINKLWLCILPFAFGLSVMYYFRHRTENYVVIPDLNRASNLLRFGNSYLDLNTFQFNCNGHIHKLTYREAKLLKYLVDNRGSILNREDIIQDVWGDDGIQIGRSLDVFVSRLRKLIKDDANLEISTVHGIGYRLDF